MGDNYIIVEVEVVNTDIRYRLGDIIDGREVVYIESFCQEYGMPFYALYDSNPNRNPEAELIVELTGGCLASIYQYCDVY